MPGLPDPEIMPSPDDLPLEGEVAEVIDLQPYLEEQIICEIAAEVADGELVEPLLDALAKPPREISKEQARLYAEELKRVERARQDPDTFEAMAREYRSMIRLIASRYFLYGGTNDDLVQEAMLGFYKGIRDYDGEKSSFRNFAVLCIRRQVITAVKTSTRNKHGPLNHAVSFSGPPPNGDTDGGTLGDIIPSPGHSPEEIVISREALGGLVGVINSELSWTEYNTLKMLMDGETYETIAEEMDTDTKSVDNALQRAKRKISEYLESNT